MKFYVPNIFLEGSGLRDVNFKDVSITTDLDDDFDFCFNTIDKHWNDKTFNYVNYFHGSGLEHLMLNTEFELHAVPMIIHKSLKHRQDEIVFVRPNSGGKPFTGFVEYAQNVDLELSKLIQTERNMKGDELCVVSPFQLLEPLEARFWIIDGKIATASYYSREDSPEFPPSGDMFAFVEDQVLGSLKKDYFSLGFVVDVGRDKRTGVPRIIECNGLQTSGWYPGMVVEDLLQAIKRAIGN